VHPARCARLPMQRPCRRSRRRRKRRRRPPAPARPTGVRRGRRSLRPCRSGGPGRRRPNRGSAPASSTNRSHGRARRRRPTHIVRPTGRLRRLAGRPAHHVTGPVEDASGGGAQAPGWEPHRAQVGRWLRWKPGHPVRRRPRTSRADQAPGAKVVRPVGRSTFTPGAWPAPRRVGRRQTG
jgi:hypothetical protein